MSLSFTMSIIRSLFNSTLSLLKNIISLHIVFLFFFFVFICFFFFFFFSSRRRHTRLTCDWSSDVCSSDLFLPLLLYLPCEMIPRPGVSTCHPTGGCLHGERGGLVNQGSHTYDPEAPSQIGRASCRESVDLGGRRIIKKKKENKVRWREQTK